MTFTDLVNLLNGVPVVLLVIAFIALIIVRREFRPSSRFFNFALARIILKVGLSFFILQILAVVLYQSTNLVIGNFVGYESVTEYNINLRLITVLNTIFSLIISPYWVGVVDAVAKNDFQWIRSTMSRLNSVWVMLCFFGLLLVFFSGWIFNMWLGSGFGGNRWLTFLVYVQVVLTMKSTILVYTLNGMGRLKLQIFMYVIQLIVFIPLCYLFSTILGIHGILISLITISIVNVVWMSRQCELLLSQRASGIWAR
jgi:O-antigen/teichoic acid export membrane protein